jgi:putative transposase
VRSSKVVPDKLFNHYKEAVMTDSEVGLATSCITIKHSNRGILFHEQADYQFWLSQLGQCLRHFGLPLHAFSLMPDLVYLLLTSADKRLIIKALNMLEHNYADYFNFYYRRLQKLLNLDYSILPVEADQHYLLYSRYIESAPVRGGLSAHPADYPWTSYACNALGEDTGLLTHHAGYLALGPDMQGRRSCYRDLFEERPVSASSLQRAVA